MLPSRSSCRPWSRPVQRDAVPRLLSPGFTGVRDDDECDEPRSNTTHPTLRHERCLQPNSRPNRGASSFRASRSQDAECGGRGRPPCRCSPGPSHRSHCEPDTAACGQHETCPAHDLQRSRGVRSRGFTARAAKCGWTRNDKAPATSRGDQLKRTVNCTVRRSGCNAGRPSRASYRSVGGRLWGKPLPWGACPPKRTRWAQGARPRREGQDLSRRARRKMPIPEPPCARRRPCGSD